MNKKLLILILIFIFINLNNSIAEDMNNENELVRGKVLEILSEENLSYSEGQTLKKQKIKLRLKHEHFEGKTIIVENHKDDMAAYNIDVNKGDEVLVYLEKDENGDIINGYITEIVRDKYLIYLGIIFFLLLILVGGLKGLKSIITLLITAFAVIKIMLPLILEGYNPIYLSVGISVIVIAITLIIISGFNKKALTAIIGTTGGVIVAGIITLIIGNLANLTGLGSQEAQMLSIIPEGNNFNFKGILFSGIILGSLGAVMDVSMSIASSMNEIKIANPNIDTKDLIKSGMNVGKDIMGTMSNTLILAYSGGSIQLMLLFMAHDISLVEIINRDMIASEIVRALAGSIGLIFTIPITALVASTLYKKVESTSESKQNK